MRAEREMSNRNSQLISTHEPALVSFAGPYAHNLESFSSDEEDLTDIAGYPINIKEDLIDVTADRQLLSSLAVPDSQNVVSDTYPSAQHALFDPNQPRGRAVISHTSKANSSRYSTASVLQGFPEIRSSRRT